MVGTSSNQLGVRFPGTADRIDITPDENGWVHPNQGGMSVVSGVEGLLAHQVPKRIRERAKSANPDGRLEPWIDQAKGKDSLRIFQAGEGPFRSGRFAEGLFLKVKDGRKGQIEPEHPMPKEKFLEALADTANMWTSAEPRFKGESDEKEVRGES